MTDDDWLEKELMREMAELEKLREVEDKQRKEEEDEQQELIAMKLKVILSIVHINYLIGKCLGYG